MKNLSIVFVMAMSLAAFGCKSKGSDCNAAIDHSMGLSKADMEKMPGGKEMMAKMRDLGVQHCKDDKWSDEAVKCMNDAKAEADAQTCYGKLTADQRDKMNKAAMAAMQASAPTPPTPAATGSDMGSPGAAPAGSGMMGSDTGSAAMGSAK